MQAACHFLDESSVTGKSVAIQGLGNVGRPLLDGEDPADGLGRQRIGTEAI